MPVVLTGIASGLKNMLSGVLGDWDMFSIMYRAHYSCLY